MDTHKIAEREILRQMMNFKKFTIRKLAKFSGVTENKLSRFLKGEAVMDTHVLLYRCVRTMGVSMTMFYFCVEQFPYTLPERLRQLLEEQQEYVIGEQNAYNNRQRTRNSTES